MLNPSNCSIFEHILLEIESILIKCNASKCFEAAFSKCLINKIFYLGGTEYE